MLDLGFILTVVLIHFVALVSPGPDFVIACRNTMLYNRKTGIFTAVGFGLGIGVHISYALFGLTWLISNNEVVFSLIQYAGASYLVFIGVQSLRSQNIAISNDSTKAKRKISKWKAVRIGFLTNVLNPKATLFFLSLFSTVLNPSVSSETLTLISIILVISTIIWFSLVAIFVSRRQFMIIVNRYEKRVNQFFGILLIGIGVVIVFL
jgi:RhtB (resistance to homoserine/threonine) family protein